MHASTDHRKRLTFHAFTEFGWPDGDSGLWRHPEVSPSRRVIDMQGWIELAQLAERGRFDSLFFADAVGIGGLKAGDTDFETRSGRTLLYDPAVAIGMLAASTEHLGFMFTNSILQDYPFAFARRMSTLDHITGGRVGWNIVTSYSPNAARNFGLADLPDREERYRWADEYADVTYRLWEGSWEEDALVEDAASGVYVDPDKVHKINYSGERYSVEGPHLVDPSPQRTPLLVQAGASPPGMAFASRNAELQFLPSSSPETIAKTIGRVRELAVQAGRAAGDMKFIISHRFVIGSTEEEARRNAERLDELTDWDEVAAYMGTETGLDLLGKDLDTPVSDLHSNNPKGMQGVLESFMEHLPQHRAPTVRELLHAGAHKSQTVGTPEQIADKLALWQEAGVEGVAVGMALRPGSIAEFAEHVMPVLRQRGMAQREYGEGTLRNKVMGYGDRLPSRHPAARHRRGWGSAR